MSARRVALIGGLLSAIGPISMALYTPAMTEIVHALGTTEAMVKLTLTLYFGGFACAQLVAGPLSDALGRRPVTLAFMAIYGIASLVALVAPDVRVLMAARFLQGVGASAGIAISRAIVRDLFRGEQSAQILNVIGIILAVGPAVAPTVGGLVLVLAGWREIFLVMVAFGAAIVLATIFALRETVVADRRRLRPAALAGAYGALLGNAHFLLAAGTVAASVGVIYTQATFLPFILMQRVGLSPAEFGLAMLFQSGSFLLGSLAARWLIRRVGANRLVAPGLVLVAIGSAGSSLLLSWEPTYLRVMVPVAIHAFGIALVMPAMTTAALAPFPNAAGAAASLMGFMQMGGGLAMGSLGALLGEPVLAMATIIPAMGLTSCLLYVAYCRHPQQADSRRRIANPPDGRIMIAGVLAEAVEPEAERRAQYQPAEAD